VPQILAVREPDRGQEEIAPGEDREGTATAVADLFDDQHHTRAEEHAEDRHELHVREDREQMPDDPVDSLVASVGRRIEVGDLDHSHRTHVHGEDAQQRESPEDVQGLDSYPFSHRPSLVPGRRASGEPDPD
jgi:hypothetical protein